MTAHYAELRVKYEEMLALRRATADLDPRPRLVALASRFPGALRELDALPLHEIARRIEALAHVEREPSSASDWMHAMTRFHALARGALFAKRALATSPNANPLTTPPPSANPPTATPVGANPAPTPRATPGEAGDAWPAEAEPWRGDLARVARPPRGRLMDLVYEKLAAELGTSPKVAKHLVFGG